MLSNDAVTWSGTNNTHISRDKFDKHAPTDYWLFLLSPISIWSRSGSMNPDLDWLLILILVCIKITSIYMLPLVRYNMPSKLYVVIFDWLFMTTMFFDPTVIWGYIPNVTCTQSLWHFPLDKGSFCLSDCYKWISNTSILDMYICI